MNNRQVAVLASALSLNRSSLTDVSKLLRRADNIEAHLNAGDDAAAARILGLGDDADDAPGDG